MAKLAFSRLRMACIACIAVAIAALASYFLFSSAFTISSINVSRQGRRIDVEETQKLLMPFFGKHVLLVSPTMVERVIRKAYPDVKKVSVKRNFPDELSVKIYMSDIVAKVIIGNPGDTEKAFAAILKGGGSEDDRKLYGYLSGNGVYLEYPFPIPVKRGGSFLTIYFVDWAVRPENRQKTVTEDTLHAMNTAQKILGETFGHSVAFITFYLRAQEFHVTTEGVVLWFDLAEPISAQIDRYRQFLRSVPAGEAKEYVDLRLHDRVVYK